MKFLPYRLLFLLFALLPLTGQARSIFDLMHTGADEPLALRLEVAMDSVLSKVGGKLPARVSFTDVDGGVQRWELKTSVRGKFRRRRCEFPPLKLNFSKKDLAAAGLTEFDKYKLVSTCTDAPEAADLVLKEYLAYRVYNLLTPQSFRVQRVDVTYVDTGGHHPDRTAVAFLIEDTDEMAARLGGTEIDQVAGQPASAYHPTAEATHALVQYLFSNGDYSMSMGRNLKAVRLASGLLVPVGYDFDFSGWVGAPYASPTSEIGQQSIYQRIYQGYAQPDEVLRRVADHFRDQRRNVMDYIANFHYLPVEERTVVQRFAARFFRGLQQMNNNGGQALYDQLRDGVAEVIPPGAAPESFRRMDR